MSDGLGAVPLSAYWHSHGSAEERFGLVIGTGGSLDDAAFEGALDQLREALREALGEAAGGVLSGTLGPQRERAVRLEAPPRG